MTASAWEKAPWMVGGGVEHSVELARLLAYGAFGGREGIVRPSDLKVRQMSTAGTGVVVDAGACALINSFSYSEAYIGRLPAQDGPIYIAPTGSGSGRSDMVIVRVLDPYQPGSGVAAPAESAKQTTQYIRTEVISNVPSTAETLADAGSNYTGIPLARIDLPANTSTVLDGHIKDVRRMFNAQRESGINDLVQPSARDDVQTSGVFNGWPSALNKTVSVPRWASHLDCRIILGQAGYGAAGNNGGSGWAARGNILIRLGGSDSTAVGYSVDSDAGTDRGTIVAGAASMPVPAALRGTRQDFRVRANRSTGNTALFVDEKSILSIELDWLEKPG